MAAFNQYLKGFQRMRDGKVPDGFYFKISNIQGAVFELSHSILIA